MPCQKLHPSPDLTPTLTELLGQIWKAESTHHRTKVLLDEFNLVIDKFCYFLHKCCLICLIWYLHICTDS